MTPKSASKGLFNEETKWAVCHSLISSAIARRQSSRSISVVSNVLGIQEQSGATITQKFGLFLQDFRWCDPNGANQAPVAPPVKETSPKGMDTLASTSLLFTQCLSLEL